MTAIDDPSGADMSQEVIAKLRNDIQQKLEKQEPVKPAEAKTVLASEPPKVLLKGLMVNPWSPSVALFDVELDVTDLFTPEEYMMWKEGLEDLLNELDRKYAKREKGLRGKRVQGDYKTVMRAGRKVRVRVNTVSPYPSRFASRLSYVRTQFYGSPNKTGVIELYSRVIHEERRGRMVFQTRLVPEADFPKLLEAMKELDRDIDKLQEDIDRYEQTEDCQKVKEYILRMVPEDRWSKKPKKLHAQLHHIHLNPWPLVASADFIETFTDPETKKQIRKSMTQVVEGFVKSAQQDLAKVTETLTLLLQKKVTQDELEKAGRTLQDLRKMTTETNTYQFIQSNLAAVESLVEAINTGQPEAVQEAAQQAAAYFDVDQEGSALDTLRAIGDRLTADLDPKIVSLINASLGG